jgi:hypothetical protein
VISVSTSERRSNSIRSQGNKKNESLEENRCHYQCGRLHGVLPPGIRWSAPINAAFAKLPAGTVGTLLKPENKDTLTKLLTYHVVAGRMSAMDLKRMCSSPTA